MSNAQELQKCGRIGKTTLWFIYFSRTCLVCFYLKEFLALCKFLKLEDRNIALCLVPNPYTYPDINANVENMMYFVLRLDGTRLGHLTSVTKTCDSYHHPCNSNNEN